VAPCVVCVVFVVVTALDVPVLETVVLKFDCCCCCACCAACACAYADDNEAPETPPVGEVEAFCIPERARNAERKLEKKGRLVVIVSVVYQACERVVMSVPAVRRCGCDFLVIYVSLTEMLRDEGCLVVWRA
jgi:hypothetical protein